MMLFDRRTMLAGTAAALAGATLQSSARAAASNEVGKLVAIRGTRLWVEDHGPRDAPALVYVHGGPGIGALDFEYYMRPYLGGNVRWISVDQRGVLRSDPMPAAEHFSVADLVADLEALREALGIGRWQVVGHSMGGHYALRYALTHPERVTRLTLESASFDVPTSFRWLLGSAAHVLQGIDTKAADDAWQMSQPTRKVDAAYADAMGPVLGKLGAHRQDLYVAQTKNRDIFTRLAATAGLPDARWEQGVTQAKALFAAGDIFDDMIAQYPRWKGPTLMVRGSGDYVAPPVQQMLVEENGGRVVTVPDAGHFVHVEAPEAFAKLLTS